MKVDGIRSVCCKAPIKKRNNTFICSKCGHEYVVEKCYIDMLGPEKKGTRGPLSLMYETTMGVSIYSAFRTGALKLLGGDVMGDRLETLFAALAMDVGRTGNYLDLSCGPGKHARELCEYNPDIYVYGLDVSGDMLGRACEKPCPNISFIRADAHALPFISDFFNGVYCLGAMYLYPEKSRVISEVFRVLRPGARFVSVDFSRPEKGFKGYAFRQAMRAVNVTFTNKEEVQREFKSNGFQSIMNHDIGPLIITLAEKPED